MIEFGENALGLVSDHARQQLIRTWTCRKTKLKATLGARRLIFEQCRFLNLMRLMTN